jgi:hypothetical protein
MTARNKAPSTAVAAVTAMADLHQMTTPELRAELVRGLSMTAEGLVRMSAVWRELEDRGEDLSDLRHGIATFLPLIAAGRLAPEAVVAFASRRSVLRALEGLPLDEQRRLAAGGLLAVIDPSRPGEVIETRLDLLPSSALALVFDDGAIRPPQLQRVALRARSRDRRPVDSKLRYRPHYDREKGTVRIGRLEIRLTDLLSELSSAAGPDKPPAADIPEEILTAKVRLSKEEYERFQALCRRHELPDWEMLRKAMRAFGLI